MCFNCSAETPSLFSTLFNINNHKQKFCYSGKKLRNTVLICWTSDDVKEGRIQINKAARNNLQVKLGDLVNVHQCLKIQYCGKRVHIHPFGDSVEVRVLFLGVENSLIFLLVYRPVRKGDTFLILGGMRTVEFKVFETDRAEYCIVSQDTVIHNRRSHNLNAYLLTHIHLHRGWPGHKRRRDKLGRCGIR
jgi:hypothetical protein